LREIGAMHDLSVEAVRQIIGRDERAAGREEEYQRAVLSAPSIEALPLETIRARISARIFYCFQNEGCDTVGRAMKIPERKLLLINNFGRLSLNEWKAAVARIKTDWLQAHTKDVQAR
jgi:DNA-directed RNA polymerase alpha subunit